MRAKRNGTHDPIAKLLVQHRFIRIPIILHNLIQAVDQRLSGRHLHRPATVGETSDLRLQQRGLRDVQDFGQVLDVVFVGARLAVEECCDGDFVAPEGLGDGFEAEVFGLLLGEEDGALRGEAVDEALLG